LQQRHHHDEPCSQRARQQNDVKGKWPVTLDGGTLACDTTKADSLTFAPDGTTDIYAENGSAMGWASKEGWKNFRDIWAIDPDGPGPNVDATDFDNEGHKLCGK